MIEALFGNYYLGIFGAIYEFSGYNFARKILVT